jgi:hypothetical protein
MMMILKTNLGELGIGSISGHHHDNYGCCQHFHTENGKAKRTQQDC